MIIFEGLEEGILTNYFIGIVQTFSEGGRVQDCSGLKNIFDFCRIDFTFVTLVSDDDKRRKMKTCWSK